MDLIELYQKNEFATVIEEWKVNQHQLSTDSDLAFVVAASHFRLGNFVDACKICEELEGVLGGNANFLAMYAAILRRLMLHKRAEEIFEKAIEIDSEAKDVRNNYSNLLIDLKRYDEAKAILEKLVEENPEYFDARENLKRLEEKMNEKQMITDEQKEMMKEKKDFGDPLDEAFELSEVTQCGSKVGSVTAAVENLLPDAQQGELEQADLELIELAAKLIKEKQFNGSLEMLEKLRKRRGIHSSLYQKACEAYIGLENYREAEIMGLISFIQGDTSIANSLNLASLAAMRKDQLMASFWLTKARNIEESNELLLQCTTLLFRGKAKKICLS